MEKIVDNFKKRWTKIAETFDTPSIKRTNNQYYIALMGLCYADNTLSKQRSKVIDLLYKLGKGRPYGFNGYWWRIQNSESDKQRATLAGFIAAMGEKEYNRITERR